MNVSRESYDIINAKILSKYDYMHNDDVNYALKIIKK